MEVKQITIWDKHIGYYFYFKKYRLASKLSNLVGNKLTNYSPVTKSNLNRPSVKLFNLKEESVKSSRIYNEVELKTILHKYNVEIKNN